MKIVCFGDSNTYGFDPRSYFGGRYEPEHRWVDILGERLSCGVVNAGENGREVPWRTAEVRNFRLLMERHPQTDLLIIMLGTNDILQGVSVSAVAERMECFLREIKLDKSGIILVAPPQLCMGEWVSSQNMIRDSIELSRCYETVAKRSGVSFADAGQWKIPLTFDGVHFTEEGHRKFAEEICDYLRRRKINASDWNEST